MSNPTGLQQLIEELWESLNTDMQTKQRMEGIRGTVVIGMALAFGGLFVLGLQHGDEIRERILQYRANKAKISRTITIPYITNYGEDGSGRTSRTRKEHRATGIMMQTPEIHTPTETHRALPTNRFETESKHNIKIPEPEPIKTEYERTYIAAVDLFKQEKYPEAQKSLEGLIERDPAKNAARIHFLIGMCHLNQASADNALSEFEKVQAISPEYPDLRRNLSIVYTLKGDSGHYLHEQYLRKAISLDSTNIKAIILLADTLFSKRTYGSSPIDCAKESFEHYSKALELGAKEKAKIYFRRGMLYQRIEQYPYNESLSELFKSLQEEPDYKDSYDSITAKEAISRIFMIRGERLLAEKKTERARDYFKKVLEYDPEAEAKNKLRLLEESDGDNYFEKKEFISAIEKYQEAQKYGGSTSDKIIECRYQLGMQYAGRGDYNDALEQYKIILKEQPQHKAEQAMFEALRRQGRR